MKSRYVVVNQFERDVFEKTWQLPYGYSNCFITHDAEKAVKYLHTVCETHEDPTQMIVEEISDEGRDLYYRI